MPIFTSTAPNERANEAFYGPGGDVLSSHFQLSDDLPDDVETPPAAVDPQIEATKEDEVLSKLERERARDTRESDLEGADRERVCFATN